MEIWLDTINFDLIAESTKKINITGVTTNPSILARSTKTAKETIYKLLDIQSGMVAVQVTASDHVNMIQQARFLSEIDSRIIVKIPVNNEGLLTIRELTNSGIKTMATAIFEINQVMLSAMAGSIYAAPYLGRINGDSFTVLGEMLTVIDVAKYPLKIIAAAIRDKEHVVNVAKSGVHAITIPEKAFCEFINDLPDTTHSLAQFETDWNISGKTLDL